MSFAKTFSSAVAFRVSPDRLLDMAAVGLGRMQSAKDGRSLWNIDSNLRNGDALSIHATCPITALWGYGNAKEGWGPSPTSAILSLVCRAIPYADPAHQTGYSLRLDFDLGVPDIGVKPEACEYHILFACAHIASYFVEQRILADNQLPGFWTMVAGAWQDEDILRPTAENAGRLIWRVQPFSPSGTDENRLSLALRIRNWVTGCVKWCDLVARLELNVPARDAPRALQARAQQRMSQGDITGAIADWSDLIEMPRSPSPFMAEALLNRAAAKTSMNDLNGAIADYQALLNVENVPAQFATAAEQHLQQLVPIAFARRGPGTLSPT